MVNLHERCCHETSLAFPAPWQGQLPARRMQAGQAVEVNRGRLAGLSGVLASRASGSRWTVRLDGMPGAVLVIDAIALTPRRRGA